MADITREEFRRLLKEAGGDLRMVDTRKIGRTNTARKPTVPVVESGQTYMLVLSLPPKGKARGRSFIDDGGGIDVRRPADYTEWLRQAQKQITSQWTGPMRLERVRVDVKLIGGAGSCDGDNAIGSVLDAMVKAGVIKDDRLRVVRAGSWEWVESDSARIEVTITT